VVGDITQVRERWGTKQGRVVVLLWRQREDSRLSSTDTDTCVGIGRIRIRGYGNFPNNPIRGYVLTIFLINNNSA